jgi:transcriptional regulator with XRE-family HTH domain
MPRQPKKPLGPRPALGLHLSALRKAAGLTQTELASLLQVPQANIAFWERSSKPPRSDVLSPMAKALGVTVETLLSPPKSSKAASAPAPRGHAQRLFAAVTKLPRSEQRRIFDVLEALVAQAQHSRAA